MMSEVPICIGEMTIVSLASHDVLLGNSETLTVLVLSLTNRKYLFSYLASKWCSP